MSAGLRRALYEAPPFLRKLELCKSRRDRAGTVAEPVRRSAYASPRMDPGFGRGQGAQLQRGGAGPGRCKNARFWPRHVSSLKVAVAGGAAVGHDDPTPPMRWGLRAGDALTGQGSGGTPRGATRGTDVTEAPQGLGGRPTWSSAACISRLCTDRANSSAGFAHTRNSESATAAHVGQDTAWRRRDAPTRAPTVAK